jgi:hypothetical protein
MEHSTDFSDPADWTTASYLDNPIDHLEPLDIKASHYREASLRFLRHIAAVDTFMSTATDTTKSWCAVSISLGLMSTRGRSESSIAEEMGISRACVSKYVTHLQDGAARFRCLRAQVAGGSARISSHQWRDAARAVRLPRRHLLNWDKSVGN